MLLRVSRLCALSAVVVLSSCSLFSEEKVPLEGERVEILDVQRSLHSDYAKGFEIKLPTMVKNNAWYQNGGNAEHKLTHLAGSNNFVKKWDKGFGKSGSRGEYLLASPVSANGVIYTIDADAKVTAFNLTDGKEVWVKKISPQYKTQKEITMKGAGLAVSPAQGKVFATTGFGMVYALNVETGKREWKFDAEAPIRIAPTVGGGMVFVQTVDNTLIALEGATGEEAWRYKTSNEQTVLVGGANPAYSASRDVLIAAFSNGELRAFKASTGSPLWSDFLIPNIRTNSLSSINSIKSNPVIDGDVVYAAGGNDLLVAIDLRDGSRIWEKEIGTSNPIFVAGKYLFVLDNSFEVAALNANDGKVYWASKLSAGKELKEKVGAFAVGPVLINDKLIVATSNGYAFAIYPYDGKVMATRELKKGIEVAPIVVDGYTIFTTNDADIVVYE